MQEVIHYIMLNHILWLKLWWYYNVFCYILFCYILSYTWNDMNMTLHHVVKWYVIPYYCISTSYCIARQYANSIYIYVCVTTCTILYHITLYYCPTSWGSNHDIWYVMNYFFSHTKYHCIKYVTMYHIVISRDID